VIKPSSYLSALLLRGERTTVEDRNIARFLDFFGVQCTPVVPGDNGPDEHDEKYVIVSSADCMAEALQSAGQSNALPPWIRKATSVYLHSFQPNVGSNRLLRLLMDDSKANVRPLQKNEITLTIAADSPEICGPMSGMRVPVTLSGAGSVFDVRTVSDSFQSLVQTDDGPIFLAVTFAGVRFYLNTWTRTLDIDALSPEYFDVKKFFCEAVPFVFFVKRALRNAVSSSSGTSACLIVDDPPLRDRYGFLDFREALELMDRHRFTSTIAFIPWNWHRSQLPTLRLFQQHPERFSLVVHGCDHTAGEFAIRSPELLNRKIQTSLQRMERLEQRASLKANRVMVFPQGKFSPETGRALKLNGFVAAVNTEVAPAQESANETTIADLWNVAIMKYGTFPIFTRRYIHHGIENFAFDGLLGKPCLIAAHHDVFKDHARHLVDFIERLNSLKWNLVWRPLGEAVRRSCTTWRLDDGTSVVQMCATSLLMGSQGGEMRRTLLLKQEADPGCIATVQVNQAPVEFGVEGGYLRVWLTMAPGETAEVRVVYHNQQETTADRESPTSRLRVAANRYLSEFRDNYLSRNEFLYQGAYRLKHFMK
jgi:hypothetical protein